MHETELPLPPALWEGCCLYDPLTKCPSSLTINLWKKKKNVSSNHFKPTNRTQTHLHPFCIFVLDLQLSPVSGLPSPSSPQRCRCCCCFWDKARCKKPPIPNKTFSGPWGWYVWWLWHMRLHFKRPTPGCFRCSLDSCFGAQSPPAPPRASTHQRSFTSAKKEYIVRFGRQKGIFLRIILEVSIKPRETPKSWLSKEFLFRTFWGRPGYSEWTRNTHRVNWVCLRVWKVKPNTHLCDDSLKKCLTLDKWTNGTQKLLDPQKFSPTRFFRNTKIPAWWNMSQNFHDLNSVMALMVSLFLLDRLQNQKDCQTIEDSDLASTKLFKIFEMFWRPAFSWSIDL